MVEDHVNKGIMSCHTSITPVLAYH